MNGCRIAIVCFVVCTLFIFENVEAEPRRGGRRGGGPPDGKPPTRGTGHSGQHGKWSKGKNMCNCSVDGQKAIEVFTDTAAGSEKKVICAEEEQFICYKVCETDTCTSYTMECIKANITTKPGSCPTRNIHGTKTGSACTADGDCKGMSKCCTLEPNTAAECVEPVQDEVKCGTCPANSDSCTLELDEVACVSDEQCPGSHKCCDCGATKKCIKPDGSTVLA